MVRMIVRGAVDVLVAVAALVVLVPLMLWLALADTYGEGS